MPLSTDNKESKFMVGSIGLEDKVSYNAMMFLNLAVFLLTIMLRDKTY